jgi:hypothetical protein
MTTLTSRISPADSEFLLNRAARPRRSPAGCRFAVVWVFYPVFLYQRE